MTTNLRDALWRVYEQHGLLTPTLLVDVARDPKHELHNKFEWDDTIAAEAWRREQAQRLIQEVRIVYRQPAKGQPGKSVRAFHAVPSEHGTVYEPAEKIVRDPLLVQMVLQNMRRDWETFKRRYENFEEFWFMVRGDIDGSAA